MPPPLALGSFLPYRLSILAEGVSRALARQYAARFGLTIPEWRVVAVLGESGAQTTKQVIARTRMDRVAVSRAAIRLEAAGTILRAPVPGDMRAHHLRLSRRGAAIYRQVVPLARAMEAALYEGFSTRERQALDAALDTLQLRADELAAPERPHMQRNPPSTGRIAPVT